MAILLALRAVVALAAAMPGALVYLPAPPVTAVLCYAGGLVAAALANGGRSLAVGPGVASTHAYATQVAAAVAILNSVAGNLGETVHFVEREQAAAGAGSYGDMQRLVERIAAGEVGALLVHGPNPLYALPGSDAVAAALERVPFIASFASFPDETSERAQLLLPDHHFLESWDDHLPRTSTIALVQPVMTPVFSTKQTGDVLLSVGRRAGAGFAADADTYHDYLRERWRQEIYPAAGATEPFDATGCWKDLSIQGDAAGTTAGSPCRPHRLVGGNRETVG